MNKIDKIDAGIMNLYKEYIQQLNDDLLEQADSYIDNHRKAKNKDSTNAASNAPNQGSERVLRTDNSLRKPQHAWWKSVDNSYHPFVTSLKSKPNGLSPIPQEIIEAQKVFAQNPSKFKNFQMRDHKIQESSVSLPNPYKFEIESFDNHIDDQLDQFYESEKLKAEPQKYKSIDETSYRYIDTQEALADLANDLKEESTTEIAIDLEAHADRSYQGFTCLIQISTRSKDFIVDALGLREHIGDALRPIFDNPKKVKVLHGADNDIQWLQRDFGLYIVNMFDTGQAARVL